MAQDKFGVKEVMDVTFYSLVDHRPVLYVDTLKLSNLENTAEESMARGGRGNPILLTWDYNREANFAVQDALISFDGLALMTGNPVAGGTPGDTEVIYKREELTVTGGAVTLSETPVDPAYSHDPTNINADPDSRVFVYDSETGIAGGTVGSVSGTSVTGITEATKVVAYYPYLYISDGSDLQVVTVSSDNFPGYYKVVGETLIRNASTGVDEPFQLVVERAKVEPGFTLTMEAEGDPSVFDMNLKVMRPMDGTEMIKMIKYAEGS
jgi:hypothetical protein